MKLAISTEGNSVSAHFGRCPSYTIVDIKDGEVVNKEVIDNPGHRPGFLPEYLSEKGVECVIAGGMGPRAQTLFHQKNITPIIGIQGPVDEVIDKFINQELEKGEDLCDHPHSETRCTQKKSVQNQKEINTQKKVCFTAQGDSIEDEIDPRFGRAAYFLIYDPQTKSIESTENPNKDQMQGVGIKSAQFLANNNVGTLFTGRVGPKAEAVLQSSNVYAVTGMSGTVKDVLKKYSLEVK
ncbi:MAG: hypothetical protein GF421_06715 [Candidatus Aminicenantes bacterium]|nr:hypothetical protein [Candidatus Aminicenantes bacterium]